MLSYPIRSAFESGLFDEVYVSTEDAEIAKTALKWNAALIERPARIAQDSSTVVEVCLHVLDHLTRDAGTVDIFCCIYATAIFLTPEDLRVSLAMIDDQPKADVVMGVSSYEIHPVQALKKQGNYWTHMWPKFRDIQSKFYPRLVASNGTLYWARTPVFQTQRTFYVERLKCYEVPCDRAVDIDTPDDLHRARRMMEAHLRGTG